MTVEFGIVGATVINNASEVAPLTIAIKSKRDIQNFKNNLSNTGINLSEVINS